MSVCTVIRSDLCIPRNETARTHSQFPHSCIFKRLNEGRYILLQKKWIASKYKPLTDKCGNRKWGHAVLFLQTRSNLCLLKNITARTLSHSCNFVALGRSFYSLLCAFWCSFLFNKMWWKYFWNRGRLCDVFWFGQLGGQDQLILFMWLFWSKSTYY